jgi:predicted methyltransferase
MLRTIAMTALVTAAAAAATTASAQSCGDREEVVARLGNLHAERLVAAGLQDEQHVVEVWASQDGTTWTILLSRADGLTCIVGAGNAWTSYPENQLAGIEG